MSSLSTVLQQLQQERTQAQQQVEKLNSAISVIEGLVGRNGSGATNVGARTGHTVSAASRRKMALVAPYGLLTPSACGVPKLGHRR